MLYHEWKAAGTEPAELRSSAFSGRLKGSGGSAGAASFIRAQYRHAGVCAAANSPVQHHLSPRLHDTGAMLTLLIPLGDGCFSTVGPHGRMAAWHGGKDFHPVHLRPSGRTERPFLAQHDD